METTRTNNPVWRTIQSKMKLTDDLLSLNKIVYNLWWVWSKDAHDLFFDLEADLWQECDYNPIIFLQKLSFERIQQIVNNKSLMRKVKNVSSLFEDYMSKEYDPSKPSVAYFSMEYGLTHILKNYSGGLGILAGDYLKEASDSRVDMTAVGLLYRYGYFTQDISPDGHQVTIYEFQNFNELPVRQVLEEDGRPMILAVPYPERDVYAFVWSIDVGRIKLYFLDTDNEMNSEYDRPITHQLYGGDWENRIKQEYLLGIGGILLLDKLGIKKDIYHCNEGHAAFINVQRLLHFIENEHLTFNQALEMVRASALYTVHTPVPAGHDYFEEWLLGKYMGSFPARLGISWQQFMDMGREHPGSDEKFSMSVFALNTCLSANGVSFLHGKVSRVMFQPVWPGYFAEELHVGYVTNGVHMPSWAAGQMKALYEENFNDQFYEDMSNPKIWSGIYQVSDEKLWEVRLQLKKRFLEYVANQMKKEFLKTPLPPSQIFSMIEKFNPNALLVGFARRFATYKRAHLLFSDLERLSKLVNNEKHPIHFIFAGKAHPNDNAGQDIIKRVVDISHMPEFSGKIIFLENYDILLAERLISGVDIWLNTPTRPLEASGTSGEKALMNGVLNFSVLDGWWYEGYREDAGWCLSDQQIYPNTAYQDEIDATAIFYIFEHVILPLYYAKNSKGYSPEWIRYIKNSIAHVAPRFTTKRMIDDYIERFYHPLQSRSKILEKENYSKARELSSWKENTLANWEQINVDSISVKKTDGSEISGDLLFLEGDTIIINIILDKREMEGDLGIDFVLTQYDIDKQIYQFVFSKEIPRVKKAGTKLYFKLEHTMKESGTFNYSYRMFPKHKDMSHRMDFALTRWI
ncbi:MAG: alpha-glucan family phosphorylase [Bacteroidales bacterium]|jgi:starch phosphorylase|nr:alpha-glucan family phosphorylase [Bacteroidales bacterium]